MKATSRIAYATAFAIAFTCVGAQTASAQVGVCTISGGGRVETPSGTETTFGMGVVAPALIGHATYRDYTIEPGFTFHSEVVTSVSCFPTALGQGATITGQGRVITNAPGGQQTEQVLYQIRVDDSGEGSAVQGLDLYSIFLTNGYARPEQPVIFGNIRVERSGP